MNKHTKLELIEQILNGSLKDGSYWLMEKCIYKWDKKDQCFYSQTTGHVLYGFSFEKMKDIVYELVDYEVTHNG